MGRLLSELQPAYGEEPVYQVLVRVFGEHFRLAESQVVVKANHELSASSLQSPDDLEATYREKRGQGYQGYVANVTETCDPENDLQLITKVQVAPNNRDDSQLLAEALPNLAERTDLDTLYTDGGYGSSGNDQSLADQQIEHLQTAIRGRTPNPEKLHLADFDLQFGEDGRPAQITCPKEQTVPIGLSRQGKAFVAHFDPERCAACPLAEPCPVAPSKTTRALGCTLPRLKPAKPNAAEKAGHASRKAATCGLPSKPPCAASSIPTRMHKFPCEAASG